MLQGFRLIRRGDRIRTCDPLLPKQDGLVINNYLLKILYIADKSCSSSPAFFACLKRLFKAN